MVRREILGRVRVPISEIMVDCILFSWESYSSWLRSTEPLAVIELVKVSCGAGGNDRLSRDPMLPSIYANEGSEAHAGLP